MAKKKTAKKKSTRKGGVNKTAEVKQYFSEHPNAKPAEVSEELGKRGIEVSANYVSNIKSKSGLSSNGRKRKRAKKKAAKQTTARQDMGQAGGAMMQAVELVMKAGVKEAKQLVDSAGKVVDRVRKGK